MIFQERQLSLFVPMREADYPGRRELLRNFVREQLWKMALQCVAGQRKMNVIRRKAQ